MINKVFIIPTGNELANGTVIDTDSPMIMQLLLNLGTNMAIYKCPVQNDTTDEIENCILDCVKESADLVILIGGSGSGHLHSEILGKDCTHSSIERILDNCVSKSLFGKNGHMWSRLICGYIGKALVINLPGPYMEAEAAMKAFCGCFNKEVSIEEINRKMAEAVSQCYRTYV